MQVLRTPSRKVPGLRLRPGWRLTGISDRMDQGGLIAPFRERTVCQFASVVESGMMLRFAACPALLDKQIRRRVADAPSGRLYGSRTVRGCEV